MKEINELVKVYLRTSLEREARKKVKTKLPLILRELDAYMESPAFKETIHKELKAVVDTMFEKGLYDQLGVKLYNKITDKIGNYILRSIK